MEAKVILQKCTKTKKTVGLRIQKIDGDWYRTWAFKISDKSASAEGFDKEKISGRFCAADDFPGCPYCGSMDFFHCGACNKMNCYNGKDDYVTCAWCGNGGRLTAVDSLDVSGGGY